MKTLLNTWFVIFCFFWLGIFLCHKMSIGLPSVINAYFADLLAVPVVAQLSLWFQRSINRNKNYRLSKGQLIFIIAYISLVFELILPYFFRRYTADILDLVCYCAGGLFYWFRMNK